MAQIQAVQTTQNGQKYIVTASGQILLGCASDYNVSTWTVQFVGTAWTGSTTVKARLHAAAQDVAVTAGQPVPYKKLYINGAVGDGSQGNAAITADSIIEIDSSGLDIILDVTAAGTSLAVYVTPLQG